MYLRLSTILQVAGSDERNQKKGEKKTFRRLFNDCNKIKFPTDIKKTFRISGEMKETSLI